MTDYREADFDGGMLARLADDVTPEPSAAQETLSVLLNICTVVVCIGLGLVVAHIALTALMGA